MRIKKKLLNSLGICDEAKRKKLQKYIRTGNVKKVSSMIKKDRGLLLYQKYGYSEVGGGSALEYAINYLKPKVCELLCELQLKERIDIEEGAIISAVKKPFVEVRYDPGELPPGLLSHEDKLLIAKEIISILIRYGADVNGMGPLSGSYRPLHFAAEHGWIDVIEMLIEAGADPNIKAVGLTPYEFAIKKQGIGENWEEAPKIKKALNRK